MTLLALAEFRDRGISVKLGRGGGAARKSGGFENQILAEGRRIFRPTGPLHTSMLACRVYQLSRGCSCRYRRNCSKNASELGTTQGCALFGFSSCLKEASGHLLIICAETVCVDGCNTGKESSVIQKPSRLGRTRLKFKADLEVGGVQDILTSRFMFKVLQ